MTSRARTQLEQSMPGVPARARWAFADEMLWEAIERAEDVSRGRNGRALFHGITLTGFVRLGIAAMWVVAALKAAKLLVRQALSRPRHVGAAERPLAVFVGFGARAEEALFREYETHATLHADVFRVDQTDLAGTGRLASARIADVWRSLADAVRDVRLGHDALVRMHPGRAADALTTAAKRAGDYAFARAWWKDLSRRRDIQEACFLAADVSAFAAISQGVRSIYLQHGLLSRSVWLPEFHEAYPLTRHERRYLAARLPDAAMRPSRLIVRTGNPNRAPKLLVVSGNRPHEEMMLAAPLIRHLSDRGFSIHVRLFSGESMSRFWGTADLGIVLNVGSDSDPFDQVLETMRPAFVASWGSTALVEALYHGTIPVCVARPDDRLVDATVFPLFRCSLNWPRHEPAIDEVIASPSAYQTMLQALRAGECVFEEQRIA